MMKRFSGFRANVMPNMMPPNVMPSNVMPSNVMPNQVAPMPMPSMPAHCPPPPVCPEFCPPQVLPTQYDPPLVSPGQQYVKTNIFPEVVTHLHPSHTTTVNKKMINHQHFFPHTESCVNECCETHTMCGVPYNPCCPPGPFPFGL